MIVLDASVLIAHFRVADALHERATRLLDEHAAEGFVMSVVTRAEVLVQPARTGRIGEAERALDDLEIQVIALPDTAAASLALLRAETGLRMPDCCVLQTAELRRAGLATFGSRLAGAASARGVSTLR